jgi:hypothetical protein
MHSEEVGFESHCIVYEEYCLLLCDAIYSCNSFCQTKWRHSPELNTILV